MKPASWLSLLALTGSAAQACSGHDDDDGKEWTKEELAELQAKWGHEARSLDKNKTGGKLANAPSSGRSAASGRLPTSTTSSASRARRKSTTLPSSARPLTRPSPFAQVTSACSRSPPPVDSSWSVDTNAQAPGLAPGPSGRPRRGRRRCAHSTRAPTSTRTRTGPGSSTAATSPSRRLTMPLRRSK